MSKSIITTQGVGGSSKCKPRPGPAKPIRQTHTFVTLEVPSSLFDHVFRELEEAGYDHAFIDSGENRLIDMNGIALKRDPDQVFPNIEAPHKLLSGKKAVVLYFDNDKDRDKFIKSVEIMPNMKAHRLQ